MAKGNCKRVSGIQMLGFQLYAQGFFQHKLNLLLSSGSVSHNGFFGFTWSILCDLFHTVFQRCQHCCTLSPSQLKDHLGILTIERRFNSQLCRIIAFANLRDTVINSFQFGVGVLFLSQIQHSHVYILSLLALTTNNTKPQQLCAGVYSKYDALVSQSCQSRCRA